MTTRPRRRADAISGKVLVMSCPVTASRITSRSVAVRDASVVQPRRAASWASCTREVSPSTSNPLTHGGTSCRSGNVKRRLCTGDPDSTNFATKSAST
jgi:hypothetical protein